jgi:hypothetical protein
MKKKRRILFTVDYYQEPGPSTSTSPPDSQAASTSYEPLFKKSFTSQPHETSTDSPRADDEFGEGILGNQKLKKLYYLNVSESGIDSR